jgi:hypothetical protein
MICANHLLVLYRAYAFRVGARIKLVEQAVSCPAEVAQLSDDERRNEPATYGALFSSECQWLLEELYQKALLMMRGRPLVDCDEALNGLVFLQEMRQQRRGNIDVRSETPLHPSLVNSIASTSPSSEKGFTHARRLLIESNCR